MSNKIETCRPGDAPHLSPRRAARRGGGRAETPAVASPDEAALALLRRLDGWVYPESVAARELLDALVARGLAERRDEGLYRAVKP